MTVPAPGRARPWVALVALALMAILVAVNLAWVRLQLLRAPPPWDQAFYQFLSLRYRHAWQDGGAGSLVREIATGVETQAPLLPLTTLPFYAALGETRLAAYAASSVYGCLLLGAMALLARRRAGDGGALLALVLGAACSAPMLLSRDYEMDLPAAALLAAALVAAERSDAFRRRAWAVAAGVLAGLTALAKTMAAPFLVAPALYVLRGTWRAEDRKRVAANLLLATGAAACVASLWWGPNFRPAVRYLLHYAWGEGAMPYDPLKGGPLLSLRNFGYYTVAIANEGASVPLLAIAAVLLALEARRRFQGGQRPPLDGLMWAWLLGGYLLLTVVRNKASDRYSIFLIPPLVLLVATALQRQTARWRPFAVGAALLAAAANYVGHTWPGRGVLVLKWTPPLRLKAYTPRQTWLRTLTPIPAGDWPIGPVVAGLGAARMAYEEPLRATLAERAMAQGSGPPEDRVRTAFRALLRREPDPVALRLAVRDLGAAGGSMASLVAALSASPEAAARPLRVLVVPDHPYVNAGTLLYRAEWGRAPVTFVRLEPGADLPDLEDFDAVVVKSGVQGPGVSTASIALVQERLGRSRFRLLPSRYGCPDQSEVRLYFLAAPDQAGSRGDEIRPGA